VTPGSGPRYRTVGMALRLHKIHRARLYTCASTDVRSQTCDGNAGLVCTGVGCYRSRMLQDIDSGSQAFLIQSIDGQLAVLVSHR
jgi:hypothetical protein